MMHWRLMVADAESLLTEPSELTPARIRTIISRSYYAAYHACLEYAERQGYIRRPNAGGVHEQLLGFMMAKAGSLEYKLGKRLMSLRDRRVKADYYRNVLVIRCDAEDALDVMTDIVRALTTLPN